MTTMQCEPFSFGGCAGNSNNFYDLDSCMEYCSPKKCEYRRVCCDVLPLSNPEVTATSACADCCVAMLLQDTDV